MEKQRRTLWSWFFRSIPGRIIFWTAVAVASYTVLGFLVLPLVVKAVLPSQLQKALHRPVAIERVRFNPYTLHLTARGLTVAHRTGSGRFASIDEVALYMAPASVVKRALILSRAEIRGPSLSLARLKDGSYNFQDLIPKGGQGKPTRFSLNNVIVTGGSVDFLDEATGARHTVRAITLQVPFISNIPYYADTYIHPLFSATIDNARYEIKGETKPFSKSLETEVHLGASGIELARYLPYLPSSVAIKALSGLLDLDLSVSYRQYEAKQPTLLVTGRTALQNLSVTDRENKPVVRVPRIELAISGAELFGRDIHIGRLALSSPSLVVTRSADGRINLLSLVPAEKTARAPQAKPQAAAPPLKLSVDELTVSGGKVALTDRAAPKPFSTALEAIDLRLTRFTNGKGRTAPFSLDLRMPPRGQVSLKGQVGIDPLTVAADALVRDVALAPFQPYVPSSVRLAVERGALSAKGSLSATRPGRGAPALAYKGSISSAGFSSTDPHTGKRFLAWKSLTADAVSASSSPPALRVEGLSIAGFYVSLAILEDGTLNVQHILGVAPNKGPEGKTPPPAKEAKAAGRIHIGTMTLKEGTANFSDSFIKPAYSARLTGMSGTVSPISSESGKPASIDLKGQVNSYAPLQVTGTIDLFRPEAHADITASVSGLDLTSMSPYSAHFVGYTIQRGTLTLRAKYLLSNNRLKADNRAGLARFNLGRQVESHPVIDLPIKLAISILKDREGNINLDIPVTGDLASPHFSFGGAILGAIKNVFTKIITSPFSFLASLVGGHEKDLGYVEFPYGSADVPKDAAGKLDFLSKAVLDRPSLKLNMAGYVDAKADGDALKQNKFLDLLKEQKMKDLKGRGGKPVPLKQIEIGPDEYTKYLEKAYHAAKIPKPKDFLGLEKSVPPTEMENLLKASVKVTGHDLTSLALDRAVHVRTYLLGLKLVGPERLLVAQSDPLHPPEKKGVKKSRVEFGVQG